MLSYRVAPFTPDDEHRSRRRRDNPRYCIEDAVTGKMLHNAGGFGFTDFATAHVFWLSQGKGRLDEYLLGEKAIWAYFREHVMDYVQAVAHYDELAANRHVIQPDKVFKAILREAMAATGFDIGELLRFLAMYPEDDPEIFYDGEEREF